jgi:hypothetical protein
MGWMGLDAPTTCKCGLRVVGASEAVAMNMRRRRAGQLNLARCRSCTGFRPDDGRTPWAERKCFQRRGEGGQLLSQVPCGHGGASGLFRLNGDDPLVDDIRCAHGAFGFRLAPTGVTLYCHQ